MMNANRSFLYCSTNGVMRLFFSMFLYIIVFFITFPFMLTFLIYVVNKLFNVHPLKAFHRSMAWSTLFYICAVIQMLAMYFDRLFVGGIAAIFLLMLSFIIIVQRRKEVEIKLKKASRLLWRMCFLLFLLLYMVLVFYGVVIRL